MLIAVALGALSVLNAVDAAEPAWPECSVIPAGEKGGPAVVIDGKAHAPLWFAMNNQFGNEEVNIEQVKLAHGAGVDVFGILLRLDWNMPLEEVDRLLSTFCEANPDGYFYAHVWVGPNAEWLGEHPDDAIVTADGKKLNWVSPASEAWLRDGTTRMRTLLEHILEGPYAHQFMGVELAYLTTAEWFYPEMPAYPDYSPVMQRRFRAWLRERYGSDEALRHAWRDADVTLNTAEVPTREERQESVLGPFRGPEQLGAAADYQRCLAETTADSISRFASTIKDITRRRSLVFAFYGYTMELNANSPESMANSGHLALGRLVKCPDIDIIRAPYSYFDRAVGDAGHLHSPGSSFALHGKLGIYDDDTFTHLGVVRPEPHLKAPGWPDRTQNLDETIAVTVRSFANFFANGCGIAWFDLLADARWNDPAIWDVAARLRHIAEEAMQTEWFTPQVAVLVGEEPVHALRANTWPFQHQGVYRWRYELSRLGAPVGYYLLSDLERIPESTRVYVMPNAYVLTDRQREEVRSRAEAGATFIWLYAPDVIGPEGPDLARVADLTGIAVAPRFDDVPLVFMSDPTGEEVDADERRWIRQRWQPRMVVTSEDAEPLARYVETGEVAIAARPSGAGRHVYTALPPVPVWLFRRICEEAGVHLYREVPGMTAVVGDYLFVHTGEEGVQRFSWPGQVEQVTRIMPGPEKPVAAGTDTWQDELDHGVTAVYRCR